MAGVRAANTKPEMILRRGLHAFGFRFRLHGRKLTGKPDIVLPRYRAVIFVNGCFWHGHECQLFRWPKTREAFWREKISGNRTRDKLADHELETSGWRVLHVWECSLRGTSRLGPDKVIELAASWVKSDESRGEIRGQ